ncbi:MAG: adenylate kinase [Alphaproteobacteria bacterium]
MNIILLGAPGSGKGTQGDRLEKLFNIKKLSTGDILRHEVKEKSELGMEVKSVIEAGGLIPDEIMIKLISNTIKLVEYKNGFILDGFPRTLAQAKALSTMFSDRKIHLNAVIELKVDEQILIDRVSLRYSCAKCNMSYNNKFKNTEVQGVCDNCGSNDFIHREDDNANTLKERLNIYHVQMEQILPYYKERQILYSVNGMNDIDDVTNEINIILKSAPNILT